MIKITKRKILNVLLPVFMFAIAFIIGTKTDVKAGTWDNAADYYNTYGDRCIFSVVNEQPRVYFGSAGTTAVAGHARYKTIGWEASLYLNGAYQESVYCSLNGSYIRKFPSSNSNGTEYNLYYIDFNRLKSRFSNQAAINSGTGTLYFDAVMSVVPANSSTPNGTVDDWGNKTGEVYDTFAGISNARKWAHPDDLKHYFNKTPEGLYRYVYVYSGTGIDGVSGGGTYVYGAWATISATCSTGYDFDYWSNNGGSSNPFSVKVTSDLSYTAYGKPQTHTVSYNANGGTGAPGNQTKTYGYILTLSSQEPTRTGYIFNYWDGSDGGIYYPGSSFGTDADTIMTAHWTPITYYVSYNKNKPDRASHDVSGIMTNSKHAYDNGISGNGYSNCLSSNQFSLKGWSLKGWNTKSNLSGENYSNGSYIWNLTDINNATVPLYANWEPNIYALIFDEQASTTTGTPIIYEKYDTGWYKDKSGKKAISTITVPKKIGMKFNGYYTDKEGTGTEYVNASGEIIAPNNSFDKDEIFVYAQWTPNIYKITLDNQGANTNADGTRPDTSAIYEKYSVGFYSDKNASSTFANSKISVPKKDNYIFDGYWTKQNSWKTNDGEQIIKPDGTINNVNTKFWVNGKLFAKWIPVDYTINLDNQGADIEKGSTALFEKYGEYISSSTLSYDVKTNTASASFDYTGSAQYFTAPCDGTYTINVGGAQGASVGGANGGKGRVCTGTIELKKGDTLKINVGGAGTKYNGGYNLGGGYSNGVEYHYGGGGATDITLNDNKIIAAGGGGGSAYYSHIGSYVSGSDAGYEFSESGLKKTPNIQAVWVEDYFPKNDFKHQLESETDLDLFLYDFYGVDRNKPFVESELEKATQKKPAAGTGLIIKRSYTGRYSNFYDITGDLFDNIQNHSTPERNGRYWVISGSFKGLKLSSNDLLDLTQKSYSNYHHEGDPSQWGSYYLGLSYLGQKNCFKDGTYFAIPKNILSSVQQGQQASAGCGGGYYPGIYFHGSCIVFGGQGGYSYVGGMKTGTITDKTNSGNGYAKITFKVNDINEITTTATNVKTPSKTGYSFDGYFTEKNGAGDQIVDCNGNVVVKPDYFNVNNTVNRETTIYANWKNNGYSFVYKANGGKTPAGKDSVIDNVSYNTPYHVRGKDTFIRQGYTLTGWDEMQKDGSLITSEFLPDSDITYNRDKGTTLLAHWEPDNVNYTINYYKEDLDGNYHSKPDYSETRKGMTESIVEAVPTTDKSKFDVTGFSLDTDRSYSDPAYEKLENGVISVKILADGTTTVNYYYSRNSYTLTLKVADGDNGFQKLLGAGTKKYGSNVDIDALLKDKFAFKSWSYTDNTVFSTESAYSFKMPANDLTLIASSNSEKDKEEPISYTVTVNHLYETENGKYEPNDSQKVTEKVVENTFYLPKTNSSLNGYSLRKIEDPATKSDLSNGFIVTKDITVNVYYNRLQYKIVTERYVDGVLYDTFAENAYYNEQYTVKGLDLEKCNLTGYKLDKIAVPGFGNVNSFTVTGNISKQNPIKVYYIPRTFTVTFDANGGNITDNNKAVTTAQRTVKYNHEDNNNVSSLNPVKTGYTFIGWYEKVKNENGSDGEIQVYNAQGNCSNNGIHWKDSKWIKESNVTVYAHWKANNYTLTLDANGGYLDGGALEDGKANTIAILSPTYDKTTFNDVGRLNPQKTGYTFEGWYTAKNDGTQIYDKTGKCRNDGTYWKDNKWHYAGNAILYAHWTPNTYTVSYNANGGIGTMESDTATYDSPYTTRNNEGFKKTGYTFNGWNTKEDGTGENWTERIGKPFNWNYAHDVTLYAQWSENSYTIKFDGNKPGKASNAVTKVPASKKVKYTQVVTLNEKPSLTGWTFKGWNTQADGKGTSYSAGQSVSKLSATNGATVTLYAIWTENSYNIVFHGNTPVKPVAASSKVTGTVASIKNVKYETTFNLPKITGTKDAFALTGWKFAGWNRSKTNGKGENNYRPVAYTDAQKVQGLSATNGATVNLYAQWDANKYTIHFDKNKPSTSNGYDKDSVASHDVTGEMADIEHVYDIEKALPDNKFELHGWKFKGWNTQADGKGTAFPNKGKVLNLTTVDNATVTLYAQWEATTYTITFNSNKHPKAVTNMTGAMANQVLTYDKWENLHENKYKLEGWTFDKWNLKADGSSATSYKDKERVRNICDGKDTTLYAQWKDTTPPDASKTYLRATKSGNVNDSDYARALAVATVGSRDVTTSTSVTKTLDGLGNRTWSTNWINNKVSLDLYSYDNGTGIKLLTTYSGNNEWNKTKFDPSENTKQVKSSKYDESEGTEVFHGIATDNSKKYYPAGEDNSIKTRNLTVKIDMTAPNTANGFTVKTGTLKNALCSQFDVLKGWTTNKSINTDANGKITGANEDGLRTEMAVTVSDKKGDSTDVSGVKYVWAVVSDMENSSVTKTYECIRVKGDAYDGTYVAVDGSGKMPNLYKDFANSKDLRVRMFAVDEAGNNRELKVKGNDNDRIIINISVYSRVERDDTNQPDTTPFMTLGSSEGPKFMLNQSGKVKVVTYGYVDAVDIDFPKKMQEAAKIDTDRGQSAKNLGTIAHFTGAYVDGRINFTSDSPAVKNSPDGGCTRIYDYPFIVPLYLSDPSIGLLTKADGWSSENLVYKDTLISTREIARKGHETVNSTASFYCGTDGSVTDRLRTHLVN